MLSWVTPQDPPGDTICIKVFCPSGVEYEAALRGAILSLTEADNWENVNGQTADVVSSAFFDVYQLTLNWSKCMPVGSVIFGAWENPPDGFLLCDGNQYQTSEYPELFDAIQYNFGGAGAFFNVPDLDGVFPVGRGGTYAIGQTGGTNSVGLTEANNGTHHHDTILATVGVVQSGAPALVWTPLGGAGITGNSGSGTPHENRPPFLGLTPAISYR